LITIAGPKVRISLNCHRSVLLTIPQILYFNIIVECEFYIPTKAQSRNPGIYCWGMKNNKIPKTPKELDQKKAPYMGFLCSTQTG